MPAERRRSTPKRIKAREIEEGRRYEALPEPLRELTLNLKMIACRAETEMLALGRDGREGKPLLEELNASRTVYPGTDLRLVYELVG